VRVHPLFFRVGRVTRMSVTVRGPVLGWPRRIRRIVGRVPSSRLLPRSTRWSPNCPARPRRPWPSDKTPADHSPAARRCKGVDTRLFPTPRSSGHPLPPRLSHRPSRREVHRRLALRPFLQGRGAPLADLGRGRSGSPPSPRATRVAAACRSRATVQHVGARCIRRALGMPSSSASRPELRRPGRTRR